MRFVSATALAFAGALLRRPRSRRTAGRRCRTPRARCRRRHQRPPGWQGQVDAERSRQGRQASTTQGRAAGSEIQHQQRSRRDLLEPGEQGDRQLHRHARPSPSRSTCRRTITRIRTALFIGGNKLDTDQATLALLRAVRQRHASSSAASARRRSAIDGGGRGAAERRGPQGRGTGGSVTQEVAMSVKGGQGRLQDQRHRRRQLRQGRPRRRRQARVDSTASSASASRTTSTSTSTTSRSPSSSRTRRSGHRQAESPHPLQWRYAAHSAPRSPLSSSPVFLVKPRAPATVAMTLDVDATDAPMKILHATMSMPATRRAR